MTEDTSNLVYMTQTQKITAAAIFCSISLISSLTAAYIPRLPGWGFALFDPVSIIWIIAFLLFGIIVGIITSILGTIGLIFFDPTGIGPFMKLVATLPMLVIPWALTRFGNKYEHQSDYLLKIKIYTVAMILALFVRLLIMIPLNLVIVPLFFSDSWSPVAIIEYTLILNIIQWVGDSWIPYIVVAKSTIRNNFKYW